MYYVNTQTHTAVTGIAITDAFVVEELGGKPSRASGLGTPSWGTTPEENSESSNNEPTPTSSGLQWLVEPMRAMLCTKFTGTLTHTSKRSDRTSQTVYAFAHFAYVYSKRTTVLADLQGEYPLCSSLPSFFLIMHTSGTPATVNGVATTVLFDIMSHTVDG